MSKKTLTPEPLWDGSIDNILICINWYRANASTKQYKKWTLDYIKRNGYSKDDIEAIKACEMIAYSMVGPYCRISTQADIPLPEEGGWQRSLKQYLEILIDEGRKRIDFRSEKKNNFTKIKS
ncbi:TPA: hypothetical protein HA278_03305 [Candidatus Woesearchaeota archaeon]|jgi:hypothetical protein|nr:hypothetical protein [Candidatus Woesearchaeota archaeon]|tara:strand:+ start:1600 stop:1965 length:366 start_codon:yes stop_codon:yes gene_type:complete